MEKDNASGQRKILVLIPSSIYIDKEMQMDVGMIAPVMIPLSGRPLLNFIIEKYEKIDGQKTYAIIVNEGKEIIKQYLIRKGMKHVKLISISKRLDLGSTILFGLKEIKAEKYDELIINFGDTLADAKITESKDTIFYEDLNESFRWTTFQESKGRIEKIEDKLLSEHITLNHVFVGVFQINSIKEYIKCLEKTIRTKQMDRFYSSLMAYLGSRSYLLQKVDKWYDLGHIDNYYQAKKDFINARYFHSVKIDSSRAILEKRSLKVDEFLNEIEWYIKLPSSLQCFVPRIYDFSLSRRDPFISMEYYGYPNLGDVLIWGSYQLGVWNHIFKSITFVMDEMAKHQLKEDTEVIDSSMRDMYYEKTIKRLEMAKGSFPEFFDNQITINGKKYKPLSFYLERLDNLCSSLLYGKLDHVSIIHGDAFPSNILYDPKNRIIKMIDPRGKFGKLILYGDFRYDLAKLQHSFLGHYDFIVNGQFKVEKKATTINYEIFLTEYNQKVSEMFQNLMKHRYREHQKAIDLIESLLFLSMIPLHSDYPERQAVMLATGIEKIDKVMNNQNNNSNGR